MQGMLAYLKCCVVQDGSKVSDVQQMPVWDRGQHMWKNESGASQNVEWVPDEVPELVVDKKRDGTVLCCYHCTAAEDQRAERPMKYTAEIKKPEGSMAEVGLALDTSDPSRCVVSRVMPGGLAESWNLNAPRGSTINAGDLLVSINSRAAASSALAAIIADPPKMMTLDLQHPEIMNPKVFKTGRPLGLTVVASEDGASKGVGLKITDVSAGVVSEWAAERKLQLRVGARIVAVNGARTSKLMLHQLQTMESLDIKIIDWL
eukprot:TRINITY_DN51535_c0_g1_i1.p1 TRINITY_DN51535_c0_g1~~TRINITY_DN51535_c0_g1_i1.p1  ORF type:complete len:298 (+),score=56.93 TRINITY_DN51535_c0_g1_i1:114-896(+)